MYPCPRNYGLERERRQGPDGGSVSRAAGAGINRLRRSGSARLCRTEYRLYEPHGIGCRARFFSAGLDAMGALFPNAAWRPRSATALPWLAWWTRSAVTRTSSASWRALVQNLGRYFCRRLQVRPAILVRLRLLTAANPARPRIVPKSPSNAIPLCLGLRVRLRTWDAWSLEPGMHRGSSSFKAKAQFDSRLGEPLAPILFRSSVSAPRRAVSKRWKRSSKPFRPITGWRLSS